MFIGLIRLAVIWFVVLTIIYVCVSLYSRSVRKGKLRDEWEEGPKTQPLSEFLDEGLEDYDGSFRRKLILGVYIVPTALVCVLIYVTNFM
jgi:hypothetical protein